MVPAPDNDPLKPSDYRIPYLERLGQNKILKGTISVTFLYLFYSPADTIRYDFYLKDRAENLSNTVSTSEIILSENGTYDKVTLLHFYSHKKDIIHLVIVTFPFKIKFGKSLLLFIHRQF